MRTIAPIRAIDIISVPFLYIYRCGHETSLLVRAVQESQGLPRGIELLNWSRPLLSLHHDKLDPHFLFLSTLTFSHQADLPKPVNRFRVPLEDNAKGHPAL